MLSGEYLWVVFALLAVGGKSAFYTLQKHLLDDASSLELSHGTAVYSFLFVVPLTAGYIHTQSPTIANTTLLILGAIGVVEALAFFVYLTALKRTDLGLATALKNTKPTFVSLSEPLVFGIPFSPVLIAAATSTSLGAYLTLSKKNSVLDPLRRVTDPGILLALVAVGLYTILSLASRYANTTVSPVIFGAIVFGMMSVIYSIVRLQQDGREAFALLDWRFVVLGGVGAFRSLMVWGAYALAAATLVSTVSQLTVLTNIIIGTLLFNEKSVKRRLVGGTLIIVGASIAILAS